MGALSGKVALVTGAGRNIGRAIALALAADGAAVAVNTRTAREEADRVVGEIRSAGGLAEAFPADITDPAQVRGMVDEVTRRLGPIGILVLNASVRREVRFADMDFEEWRRPLGTSLDGAFHCIKACLPAMTAAREGCIIALTGDSAVSGAIGKAHSSAAKSGLAGLVRALANELAPDGIRVNCVSPGHIDTTRPSHRSARPPAEGLIPLGRHGKPEEIAAAVCFLCGPGGTYITGQTLHVNGGMHMYS